MITLTRVHNHGDIVEREYDDTQLAFDMANMLIEKYRNCGIFCNGKCIHVGLLGREKSQELEKQLS